MKSPKAILAESIAAALADYFVIDPAAVETNLFRDAAVTLNDVQLKPVENVPISNDKRTCASITGSVKAVAFQWKWGRGSEDDSTGEHKEGGSSFVHSATLSIDGLDFCATLSENHNTEHENNQLADDEESKSKAAVKINESSLPSSPEAKTEKSKLTFKIRSIALSIR